MKHYLYITFALICTLSFASCESNNEDKDLSDWKAANEQAFNAIKANSEYRELKSPGNEGSVYYRVLQEGTGTKPIYYSSTVIVYYKGAFVAASDYYGIKKDYVFNSVLFDDGEPVSFTIKDNIAGWKTALPYMKQGDKWEIFIPYQLGYGSYGRYDSQTGAVAIPPYSTLVFEIEVVDVL